MRNTPQALNPSGVQRPLLSGLTRSERRELNRREEILIRFRDLTGFGFSQAEAARMVGSSVVSLWRWQRRLVPCTSRCGRKPTLKRFQPPFEILKQVRLLQVSGMSNAAAWRAVGKDARCPALLAKFLKKSKTIPPSFLAATRLDRRTIQIVDVGDGCQVTIPK